MSWQATWPSQTCQPSARSATMTTSPSSSCSCCCSASSSSRPRGVSGRDGGGGGAVCSCRSADDDDAQQLPRRCGSFYMTRTTVQVARYAVPGPQGPGFCLVLCFPGTGKTGTGIENHHVSSPIERTGALGWVWLSRKAGGGVDEGWVADAF